MADGATTTSMAISARGVEKTYVTGDTRVTALRGADLEVQPGEVVMLVGPSGCGKTSLISILAGLLSRDGGSLEVFGQDPQALSNEARTRWRRENIGFVFQQFNLIPTLTIAENVAIPLVLHGISRSGACERAAAALAEVGLEGRQASRPNLLSGGQQQRVAIARALVNEPRLLVCDEPTSALDGQTGQRIMELVARVGRHGGRAAVVVTHDERIFHLADRIIHMDDGCIDRIEQAPRRSHHE